MEVTRELGEFAKEAGTIVKEGRQEFAELMTDGFKEMVIKDNSNYKTSFEKKDDANGIINGAKNRLTSKLDELDLYANQTEGIIKNLYEYKMKVTNDTFEIINKTINELGDYDLHNPIHKAFLKGRVLNGKVNFYMTNNTLNTASLGIIIGVINQMSRVRVADEYLENAMDYQNKVNAEIARLNLLKVNMSYIRKVIKEEKNLLQNLSAKFENIIQELTGNVEIEQMSAESRMRVENLFTIAELLNNMIQDTFISKELKVSEKYLSDLAKLKALI